MSCSFTVANPAGSVVATINATTGVLTVGNAQGAARVEATCGGVTGNAVLVSGRGGITLPPTTATEFDGRCGGQYSGSATLDGDTYPVSGAVAFTISNGVISMTQPGSGSGTVSPTGAATFVVAGVFPWKAPPIDMTPHLLFPAELLVDLEAGPVPSTAAQRWAPGPPPGSS